MDIDDSTDDNFGGEPSPKKIRKSKLRQQIADLKMDRRVGLYTSNPDKPSQGIFKAPRADQKVFRKKLKQQIQEVRSQD